MMINTKLNNEMMPVLFLGHGNPMNAIEENVFVDGIRNITSDIPKPKAIICISAHWETRGTKVTAMEKPQTIHDFGGFPRALYEVKYPASGDPALADNISSNILSPQILHDMEWGLDHGTWSVIKHMYPNAEIPVVQVSLNRLMTPQEHYDLGKQLAYLRQQGVLVVGSGNIVHNLRLIAWEKFTEIGYAYDWNDETTSKVKNSILQNDHQSLIKYQQQGSAFQLSIPTPEHYLPLLYILAMQQPTDQIHFFNDQAVAGSLSMLSVLIH